MQLVLSQGGPWAGLAFVGYLLATGRLVSRSALRDRDRLVETYWKAWDREHARCELLEKQLDESMELSRTSAPVLTAVAQAAGVGTSQGDGEDASSTVA
jgi:hypothetical protein